MISFLRNISVRQWIILGIFNLLLVAASGLLMRLKFIFHLPYISQKNLIHAHSHFAFSGWISHILMVLIVACIFNTNNPKNLPLKYQCILIINVLAAYGMFISFFFQGYGLYSICFSSVTIITSYFFAIMYRKALSSSALSQNVRNWFSAALFFLVISSAGIFFLAYLMVSHNTDVRLQLATVYFFLHFQYNGWFFFTCMGLFHHWLHSKNIHLKYEKNIFRIFALICVPAYLLSILWWNIPDWLYIITLIAIIAQTTAWAVWIHSVIKQSNLFIKQLPELSKWLFTGISVAVSVKIILQGLSVIPSLSQLAYSFRPVVIGYLHLVLLVIISLFIIAYLFTIKQLNINKTAIIFSIIFTAGVIFNELLLMTQGLSGLTGILISHIPIALALAAGIIMIGVAGLLYSQKSAERLK